MPDGYAVPPHWHSVDENLTVLQGTLLMGKGDKLDKSKAEKMPVGSFAHMPKATRHFVIASGETIIQVNGVGPFDINYVNPADDPRKKETREVRDLSRSCWSQRAQSKHELRANGFWIAGRNSWLT